nr:relaxase domain-containing protein [Hydrococcus sp. Prado102]
MLTIATITPQQGKWYYKQDNYYSQNKALSNSEWWGKGALALGLSGQIADDESYQNAIAGYHPDGTRSLREKPKDRAAKERAGVDMTFSAPKSVSLACLVGGDKRLETAHRTAVKR